MKRLAVLFTFYIYAWVVPQFYLRDPNNRFWACRLDTPLCIANAFNYMVRFGHATRYDDDSVLQVTSYRAIHWVLWNIVPFFCIYLLWLEWHDRQTIHALNDMHERMDAWADRKQKEFLDWLDKKKK
jgi:hypothetical protein